MDISSKEKPGKSVQSIKKLIKKGKVKAGIEKKIVRPSPLVKKNVIHKKKQRPTKSRGMVYISHIPHGFYEHQMTEFFKQFGTVTAARVIRSKKTGQSKGCAFVEFQEPEVGQIVADTMNNYLMGKRLLKAEYIVPEKQKRRPRMNWNHQKNPSADYRREMKKIYNDDSRDQIKIAKKLLINFLKMQKRWSDKGIDISFVKPVDVPKELMHYITGEKPETKENIKPIENKTKTKTPLVKEEPKKTLQKNQKKDTEPSKTKKIEVANEKSTKIKEKKLEVKSKLPLKSKIKVMESDSESNEEAIEDESEGNDSFDEMWMNEFADEAEGSEVDEGSESEDEEANSSDDSDGELVFGENESEEEIDEEETKSKKIKLRSGRSINQTAEFEDLAKKIGKKINKSQQAKNAPQKGSLVAIKKPKAKQAVAAKKPVPELVEIAKKKPLPQKPSQIVAKKPSNKLVSIGKKKPVKNLSPKKKSNKKKGMK